MSVVRKFFAELDMFAAAPNLRARQDDKTSSLCSGITSFLLVIFFAYVFISSAIGVVSYEKIDSVQTQSKLGFEQAKADDVVFAIRVGYLSAEESYKYFDLGYTIKMEDGNEQTFGVQKCSPEQWKRLGDSFEDLNQFWCAKPENQINLKKVYYAPNSQYVTIYVRACSIGNRSTCQTPQNQLQFLEDLKNNEGSIFTQVFLLDKSIEPNKKQPVKYVTNSDPEFSFTLKRGIIATIQLGSFRVSTDMSVFPVEDIHVQQGNFMHTFRQTSTQISNLEGDFALIYLQMNRKFILIERKVGKIDDMLSYAGGLFSIILSFLAIFLSSFNKYRYELMVAQGIFHQDQDGNAIKQHDFSFLLYIKYTIFDWISTVFSKQLKWQDCLIVDSTRDEANKQMDVTRLFRKIESLETTISYLIESKVKDCLSITKPQILTEIIKNREVLEFYNQIIQGKSAINFQQHRISVQILKFGLSLMKNQEESFKSNVSAPPFASNSVVNIALQQVTDLKQIDYNSLMKQQYMLYAIRENFHDIVQEAQNIKLSQKQKETELHLAEAYCTLDKKEKENILWRIPIKILYRLVKCWIQFKNRKQQYSEFSHENNYETIAIGQPRTKRLPPLFIEPENMNKIQGKQ